MAATKARYCIRASTYRGQAGFLVYSQGGEGGWPIKIFTNTRRGAEMVRELYKRDDLTVAERQAKTSRLLMLGY